MNLNRYLWTDAVFALFSLVGLALVFGFPSIVQFDQGFIRAALVDGFPTFDLGISSHGIAGMVRIFSGLEGEYLNAAVRAVALLVFVVPAYLLARVCLSSSLKILLFILFLFLSRLPFLWLSSELFAGGFLCLAFLAILRSWPSGWVALSLTLFGLSKPDTAIAAFALVAFLFFARETPYARSFKLPAFFCAFFGLALFPGWWTRGTSGAAARSFVAFGQHYAALFYRHQIQQPPPHPWDFYPTYLSGVFPGATSVGSAVRSNPIAYLDFVALSCLEGLRAFFRLFKFLGLFPIFRIFERRQPTLFEKLVLVSLISVGPWVLISFPHLRYFARYYAVIIICFLMFLERVSTSSKKGSLYHRGLQAILLAALLYQTAAGAKFVFGLAHGAHPMGWFPD